MNPRPGSTDRSRGIRWILAAIALVGLGSALSLAGMVQEAFTMLREGRGLDLYQTTWLVDFNWVGFLVFMACLLVALVAGVIVRYVQARRERAEFQELERLGGNGDRGA